MKINKSYKTELNLNNKQKTLFKKHAGASRFIYNWALNRINKQISKPDYVSLSRELNAEKHQEFPWMREIVASTQLCALQNLQTAFTNFFRTQMELKQGKKSKVEWGYPKFKSKKNKQSFKISQDKGTIHIKSKRVKLPRIGWVKLKQKDYIPQDKKILSISCSYYCEKWFISVNVEEEIEVKKGKGVIGIDLGLKSLAVCSDGSVIENPKALKKYEKKLRNLQRHCDKKMQKGSKRRAKVERKIAKLHCRIRNIRQDTKHKATSWIVKTKHPELIVLEDLNIQNMLQNHRLASSISDAAWHEFRRQIEYKQKWAGSDTLIAPPFYPSTQLCCKCGKQKTGENKLKLWDRIYECECGNVMDRDLNASKNLELFGNNHLAQVGVEDHVDPLKRELGCDFSIA